MKQARHNAFTAFTLVELMVVVGIVAVLAAIILPITSRAREAGRRTTCQSNLRQLAAAIHQYVQDNDGVYPLEMSERNEAGVPVAFSWRDAIRPYLKNVQVFRCPNHPSDALGEYNDYSYNATRLNTFRPPFPTPNPDGTHEAGLPNSTTIWLNVDTGWTTADGSYHYLRRVTQTSCGRPFYGRTLHSGGGNYSFLDGHVKWLTPEAMGEIECQNGPLPFPFHD